MPLRPIQFFCLSLSAVCLLDAAYQDEIGLVDLRNRDASLTGSGVLVGQIEAQRNETDYQADPANTGLNPDRFTYYDTAFTWSDGGSTFDSSRESGHANTVGSRFYGVTSGTQNTDGVAPGVAGIGVFEAGHYYNALVQPGTDTGAAVVNQSFVFPSTDSDIDRDYDDYASDLNVLFVNGIGNDGSIPSPASSYNGIAVNVAGNSASPLADGRSKPDISAPGSSVTSFVTPLVSGAAAILIQSARADHAGAGTSPSASDPRTIKALLLNGASKPEGWTNSSERPLDVGYGAGILNINQSHLQLVAGRFAPTRDEVLTEADNPHPPPSGETGSVASYRGWNLGTVTNTAVTGGPPQNRKQYDVTDHYFFDLSSDDAAEFILNATLVWNRQNRQRNINNLELFLYNEGGALVASSQSSVDNVEHIHQPQIPAGRYVLQVHKPYNNGRITNDETYALAFDFEPVPPPAAPENLSATTVSSTKIDLVWSDESNDEDGFKIERRREGESYAEIATTASNTTTYADSGLAVGTVYDYRITAFNSAGNSSAAETSGRTYSKIEAWRLSFFGTTENAGSAADGFDEDRDSIVNLIEYATGSDPTVFSENPLDAALLGKMGQVSFKWRVDSGYDFALGYANNFTGGFIDYDSTTLDSGASPKIELINVSGPVDGFETRTYGLKDGVTEPKVFLRLQVID